MAKAKSLFADAKTIGTKADNARKSDTPTINLVGMERYAALDAAIKTLTALKDVEEEQLKGLMGDHFIKEGTNKKSRPENFNGVEARASGSCQLKIRSTASALTDDERILLDQHKISYGENVKQVEAFMINPLYTNDMELLATVEEALVEVDLPEDFLVRQSKIVTKIATEDSIAEVFTKPMVDVELLLPLVTTMAIKPKIEGDFWSVIDAIMNPDASEEDKEAA